MGECGSVLGQKKSAAHRRVRVLQIVFSLSGKYTQDLWFVHRTIDVFIYLFIYLLIYVFICLFIYYFFYSYQKKVFSKSDLQK